MIIDRQQAEHYVWGGACDGWHFVANAGLSVIEERMPAGSSEARHFHKVAQQFFYVVSGMLTFERDGEECEVGAGQGVHVPPGARHCVSNRSGGDATFLLISCPPSRGDRVVDDSSS